MSDKEISKDQYNVVVAVKSEYLPDHSDEDKGLYVFAYHVNVRNIGQTPAQLMTRHWVITDGNRAVEEVRGDGVVGKQPLLETDQEFSYTSSAVLKTPVGTMHGSYGMVADDGTHFDATIEPFTLAVSGSLH